MTYIPPPPIHATPSATREVGATRVLIVDDSAVARALIARQIEPHERFRVVGAVSHVEAALAFLSDHSADIILLDVAMPGMDGMGGKRDSGGR